MIYRIKISYYLVTLCGAGLKAAWRESDLFAETNNPYHHVNQSRKYWIERYKTPTA